MEAIRLSELGSSGSLEMSWFQGLSPGNRRLPPRLAPGPSLIGLSSSLLPAFASGSVGASPQATRSTAPARNRSVGRERQEYFLFMFESFPGAILSVGAAHPMIWVNCAFALRQEIVQLIRAKLRDCSSLKEAAGEPLWRLLEWMTTHIDSQRAYAMFERITFERQILSG